MEALRAVKSTSFGCLMEMIRFCDMLRSTKECTVAAADCASHAFRSLAVQVTESALERWTLGNLGRSLYVKGWLGGNRAIIASIGFCF